MAGSSIGLRPGKRTVAVRAIARNLVFEAGIPIDGSGPWDSGFYFLARMFLE